MQNWHEWASPLRPATILPFSEWRTRKVVWIAAESSGQAQTTPAALTVTVHLLDSDARSGGYIQKVAAVHRLSTTTRDQQTKSGR
jgi:hypothetical protein